MGTVDEALNKFLQEDNARMDQVLEYARASFLLTPQTERTRYGKKEELILTPTKKSRIKLPNESIGTLYFSHYGTGANKSEIVQIAQGKFVVFKKNVNRLWEQLRSIIKRYETPPSELEQLSRWEQECLRVPAVSIKLSYFNTLYELTNDEYKPLLHDCDRYYTGMPEPEKILNRF